MRWLLFACLIACGNDLLPLPPQAQPCVNAGDCSVGQVCAGGYCADAPADSDHVQLAPTLLLLTESVRFVDVPRGMHATRRVRLRNVGLANLSIQSAEISGGSGRITVSPKPMGFTIAVAPEGEFQFTLSFVGSDGASAQAELWLTTDDPYVAVTRVPISIQYTGAPALLVSAAPNGQWNDSVAGLSINMGATPVGLGRSTTFYVKNLGQGGAFASFEAPELVGDAGFSLTLAPAADVDGRYRLSRFGNFCDADDDCAQGTCAQGVCTLNGTTADLLAVTLTAHLAEGETQSTEVRLPYSSPQGVSPGEVRWSVSATGVAPGLVAQPATVALGDVSVGYPKSALVRLLNASHSETTVASVALEDLAPGLLLHVLNGALPRLLLPFESVMVRVDAVASESVLGSVSTQLVAHTTANAWAYVPITARLREGPQLSTAPHFLVELAQVPVGVSKSAFIVLNNTAASTADPLRVDDVRVSSTNAGAAFSVVSAPTTIAPQTQGTIEITCTPHMLGQHSGVLTLVTDAPDNGVRSLVLRCEGVAPVFVSSYEDATGAKTLANPQGCRDNAFAGPCWDLGALYVGGQSAKNLTLENTGIGALEVWDVRVEPEDAPFALSGPVAAQLLPGEHAQLTVNYWGGTADLVDTAVLHFSSNDVAQSQVAITLVGSQASCSEQARDCSFTDACTASQSAADCCKTLDDATGCGPACIACPPLSHTAAQCIADACSYVCAGGYYDLNGAGDGTGGPQDGCEYACSATGVETCNGVDDDCNGLLDDGLALPDPGGEAPQTCTPAVQASLVGLFDEGDFGVVTALGGQASVVANYTGRVYPVGDVDWLRVLFGESNACAAHALRLELELLAPGTNIYELCAALTVPTSGLFDAACATSNQLTCTTTAGSGGLVFEWSEHCGEADDRVLDVRIQALNVNDYACQPYELKVLGAMLQ